MIQWVLRASEAYAFSGNSGMSKTYRPWNPDQDWLLPPSPREWLAELVRGRSRRDELSTGQYSDPGQANWARQLSALAELPDAAQVCRR